MRATRAYLTSLGTTGLLVLSSVLVLIFGSTLVAFEGWPGASGGSEPQSVLVAAQVNPEPGTGPEELAAAAAPVADAVALAAVPVVAAQGAVPGAPGGGDDGGPGPGDPGGGDPVQPPVGEVPGEPGATPTDPEPPPGDTSLVDGLADGLESTTTYLGDDVVGQMSPDLGTLLTDTGESLTDLVRALDGTVPPPR